MTKKQLQTSSDNPFVYSWCNHNSLMNFLAHLYLSGSNEPLMVGNFIADHVKGSAWKKFPEAIQKGILLHRFIDSFTDTHPTVEQSKVQLRPHFNKYTPVVMDVFYDHFLANEWEKYSNESLSHYSQRVFKLILNYNEVLPQRTKNMLGYMIKENWLMHYQTIDGLNKILKAMSRRAGFENNMHSAASYLQQHYGEIKLGFESFFIELQKAVAIKTDELNRA